MTSSRSPSRSADRANGRLDAHAHARSAFRCYVAAPFGDAPFVREVHARLRAMGVVPTSTWAEPADGVAAPDGTPEDLAALPLEAVQAIAARNDHALASSDAVLVLPCVCVSPASKGGGREMFAEARLAVAFGIPVIWVGSPRPLTAYREGVARVSTLDEALEELRRLAGFRASPPGRAELDDVEAETVAA